MIEVLITLILQYTFQINVLSSIRLIDLLLLLLAIIITIKHKRKLRIDKSILILSIIKILYTYLLLYFLGKLSLGTIMSLGYFYEFILLFYVVDNTKKENSFDVFWHFGVISWVVNIITSICLFAVFGVSKRAYGMIGSTYICFFLPFIMYGFFMPTNSRQKKKYLVLSILSILSSIISQQRTLMILCLLNAVIYILIDKRNIIKNSVKFILLGFGVALVIFYIAPPSLMEMLIRKWNELFLASNNTATGSMANRYVLWRAAINMIKQKPLFGIGSGVFSRLQIFELKQFTIGAAIEDAAGLSTHNFLLEYLVELGAIGTLITYSIVVVILKKVLSLRKNIGNRTLYISILSSIITLTIYDLFGQGTFLPFWNYVAILGVLYAEKERYKSRDILYM